MTVESPSGPLRQVNTPAARETMAPWVVARFQYRPNTSGTKAPTSVTW